MQSHEIEDVLNLSAILAPIYTDEAPTVATLISNLMAWRDDSLGTVDPFKLEPVAPQPKPLLPPEPEPEPDFEPVPEPVKAKPAKAAPKGRAKPPPPPAEPDDSVVAGSDDDF